MYDSQLVLCNLGLAFSPLPSALSYPISDDPLTLEYLFARDPHGYTNTSLTVIVANYRSAPTGDGFLMVGGMF